MRYSICLFALISIGLLVSCNKEDDVPPTGKIIGQVMHHDDPILSAAVYIKYNATEFPGLSPDLYDDMVTASAADATFEFTDLPQGAYYIFSIGEDTDCPCEVLGGIPIVLSSNSDIQETIVPVTE